MSPTNELQALDRVEITVLMDNVADSLSSVPSNVNKEWDMLRLAGMQTLAGSCQCCANHGLSLLVTSWRGEQQRTILFDAGPVADMLLHSPTACLAARLVIEWRHPDHRRS
jgi:7,8-dihydropterin-6-yl-methyl-4-(beta-D-ribofuranosyl)aminobenzene 5'-phosphate synthase